MFLLMEIDNKYKWFYDPYGHSDTKQQLVYRAILVIERGHGKYSATKCREFKNNLVAFCPNDLIEHINEFRARTHVVTPYPRLVATELDFHTRKELIDSLNKRTYNVGHM